MLTIILGWKTQDIRTEVPKALYLGVDGPAADKAAKEACESGDYKGGRIGKLIHPMVIPMPTVPTAKKAATAPSAPATPPKELTPAEKAAAAKAAKATAAKAAKAAVEKGDPAMTSQAADPASVAPAAANE